MYIVDSHVHIMHDRQRTEETIKRLKRYNIDAAVLFADSESPDLTAENRYVRWSAQEFESYPFYYLGGNPFTDTRMDLEVPDNLEEYRGVRWHGWFGESVDRTGRVDRHELEFAVMTMERPEFEALMAAIAFYSLPILFEEDFGVTAEFVVRYPNLKIIIPHMGLYSGGQEMVIGRYYQHPNVHFTTSRERIEPVTLRRIGPERLLFASDYPYSDPGEELEKIRALDLGDEEEAMVLGENIERLMNLIDPLEDDD
jgi:hypothetical protein